MSLPRFYNNLQPQSSMNILTTGNYDNKPTNERRISHVRLFSFRYEEETTVALVRVGVF